jgi:hypothetical protein
MRFYCLACLLMASLSNGQSAPPAAPPAAKPVRVQVGPDDPVITVNGFCADPAPAGDSCRTVITRSQFEKLSEALQPDMSLALRLKVANAYAGMMRMAAAAERRGLDKTPAFAEEMRYARMQLLSQDLTRTLQADANNLTDADLADYYKKNESSFEQATVARIFIPRTKRSSPNADAKRSVAQPDEAQPDEVEQKNAQQKADEAAMTKLAADLRTRAASGEDPDKLQIEAYEAAGIAGTIPNTKMEKVRRATLPPRHELVMDLNTGEVSEVFSDPAGAHFIYKMISKQILTLEDVSSEIRTAISSQRYRDSMKSFEGDVVFSDAYFNPPTDSTTPPQRNPKKRRTNPTAGHD